MDLLTVVPLSEVELYHNAKRPPNRPSVCIPARAASVPDLLYTRGEPVISSATLVGSFLSAFFCQSPAVLEASPYDTSRSFLDAIAHPEEVER